MAELMAPLVVRDLVPSVLVPAPSRARTVRRRGFALASELSTAISRVVGLPTLEVLRQSGSREQKQLAYDGRWDNMLRSVHTTADLTGTESAVIIDDVVTTGATLNACAVALRGAGVGRVEAVAFAMEY